MKVTSIFKKFFVLILLIMVISCKKEDDNKAPVINDQTFSIDENSTSGTLAGQVLASDDDYGQTLKYSILSGNTNDAFNISELDGKITVNNENAIDYETTPSFTLLIQVEDYKNKTSVANVKINLNNVIIPTTGLILYMPFDDSVNDLSGSNNNGIDYTSHTYLTGVKSKALDFNGSTDYIQLTNSINSEAGLSFSFWLKTRGAIGSENNGSIVCKYNMTNNTRSFMIYSFGAYETRNDNRLSAAFYKYGYSSGYHDHAKSFLESGDLVTFPNTALWTISNPKRLILNTWTHCIVNVTQTTIEIWLNGELCTKKLREYSLYFNSPNEPVFIGNNFNIGAGSNNHFNGTLDEFRIYSRGLTKDEIKILFKE